MGAGTGSRPRSGHENVRVEALSREEPKTTDIPRARQTARSTHFRREERSGTGGGEERRKNRGRDESKAPVLKQCKSEGCPGVGRFLGDRNRKTRERGIREDRHHRKSLPSCEPFHIGKKCHHRERGASRAMEDETARTQAHGLHLDELAIEILVHILTCLDLATLVSVGLTSRRMDSALAPARKRHPRKDLRKVLKKTRDWSSALETSLFMGSSCRILPSLLGEMRDRRYHANGGGTHGALDRCLSGMLVVRSNGYMRAHHKLADRCDIDFGHRGSCQVLYRDSWSFSHSSLMASDRLTALTEFVTSTFVASNPAISNRGGHFHDNAARYLAVLVGTIERGRKSGQPVGGQPGPLLLAAAHGLSHVAPEEVPLFVRKFAKEIPLPRGLFLLGVSTHWAFLGALTGRVEEDTVAVKKALCGKADPDDPPPLHLDSDSIALLADMAGSWCRDLLDGSRGGDA